MPFELQVALRYLLAKRRQVFISVISLVSTLGVTVGVMALVIALALMTGLQGELQALGARDLTAIEMEVEENFGQTAVYRLTLTS